MSKGENSKKPILIANRGEIAIRVARTARALGYPTVAVYSDADENAEHLLYCDQAIRLGGITSKESYLDVEKIVKACKKSGAGMVHPGYGFLSEKSHFVRALQKEKITFIGPTPESMDLMGDKVRARDTVKEVGVLGVPGSKAAIKSNDELISLAKEVGYPVLLKASAGGGGKGMRRVDQEVDLLSSFEAAKREAMSAFGDDAIYLEKYIINPHHVEIQVFGDGKGGATHLGERECSIQRRHQKVWEESPSPLLEKFDETRTKMIEAALKITKHVKYAGAGTLEFIADEKGNFYFLEMNTRLQVEHPVSEWVTGVDLVEWQIMLADQKFSLPQFAPERKGSSIEVRLYAEDPKTFLPAPGLLDSIRFPNGPFVRVDTAFQNQGEVSMHYDPMIAKISVWAPTRDRAVQRMRVALQEVRIEKPRRMDGSTVGSLQTNLSFLKKLCLNEKVLSGDTPTNLISDHPELTKDSSEQATDEAALAALIWKNLSETVEAPQVQNENRSLWKLTSREESVR